MDNPIKSEIEITDLTKIDIKVGTILSAEKVEGSVKLIKLIVDFGEFGQRQILTGMQEFYAPEDFVGMQTTFIINLKPRKMMGLESQGMIFAVDGTKPVFLLPKEQVSNGNTVI
jgi:methionine--tRNA ligase beta chain